jgi:hypothetical protein
MKSRRICSRRRTSETSWKTATVPACLRNGSFCRPRGYGFDTPIDVPSLSPSGSWLAPLS